MLSNVDDIVASAAVACAPTTLNIAATGYVSGTAGSVAGANTLLVRELLRRGHAISFHSKPAFVDPRPLIEDHPQRHALTFFDCTNAAGEFLYPLTQGRPGRLLGPVANIAGSLNNLTYCRRIVRSLRKEASQTRSEPLDVALWLGTWAYRRVEGLPTVSFVQGPPGTDARSILPRRDTIVRLGGRALYLKLRAYAKWRLSVGLPKFEQSDHIIVGSRWARDRLNQHFGISADKVHVVPYPIDLNLFRPPSAPRPAIGPLRVLWVGRFVPRKRLDLFLNGLADAIRHGVDVAATVIGRSGFVPNYEQLLAEFPYPDRLVHQSHVPRGELPTIMHDHDFLAQPSDDENFGSSVAEAQATGVPVIVGRTNGTGDYICDRSIRLVDDRPETFAAALTEMAELKRVGALADASPSRMAAEHHFHPATVTGKLEAILASAVSDGNPVCMT